MCVTGAAWLARMFVRATGARRVLAITSGTALSGLSLAEALPQDGLLITVERDARIGTDARAVLASTPHAPKTVVMIGDAARYLHKLAGPFEVVLHDGEAGQYAAMHDRVVRLLAPSATLITGNLTGSGDYNRVLAADPRLATIVVKVGHGVAVSVKRGSRAHQSCEEVRERS
jgi:caffeoyl-CoA O-methyltransferase